MAIALTVHLVESVWARRRDSGLLAPYLVVDHNGQQQQTEVAKTGMVTAWNQKAQFPYVPTSDLVIMAFDAGRHPGAYVAQAVVDVASMLQAGSLSASVPLLTSKGATLGHVAFDVELSTSSRALAAGLDLPGLTVTQMGQPGARSPMQSPRRPTLQEDHLSGSGSPFALPGLQHQGRQQQQQQASRPPAWSQAAAVDPETPPSNSRGAKLVEGLSSLLRRNKRRSFDEAVTISAAAVPCSPMTNAHAAVISRSSSSTPDGTPGSARRSIFSSSNSFSLPSAPPFTAGLTAAQAGAASSLGSWGSPTAAAGGPGSTTGPGSDTSSPSYMFGGGLRAGVALTRQRRYTGTSDCSSSMLGSEAASDARSVFRLSRQCSTTSTGELVMPNSDALSPLRSSMTKIRLSKGRHAMQQQQQQRHCSRRQHSQQEGMLLGSERVTIDDELQREYDAADAAGKEAILYKQLMLLQAEKAAGTAQLLNIIAAQQQQEVARSNQLLAALAALSPSTSPRHIKHAAAAVAAVSAGGSKQQHERGDLEQQQSDSSCPAAIAADPVAAAVAAALAAEQHERRQQRARSPAGPCYLEAPGAADVNSSMSIQDLATAADATRAFRPTSCTPEFASPNMSFRTSFASSVAPTPLLFAGAADKDSSRHCSTSSAAVAAARGNSSKNKYYPEVPPAAAAAPAAEDKPSKSHRARKQWAVGHAAGAAARELAGSLEVWHSCEGSSSEGAAAPAARAAAAAAAAAAAEEDGSSGQIRAVRTRSVGGARRAKASRMKKPMDAGAGVKSYPIPEAELRTASPNSHDLNIPASAAPSPDVQPAYRCTETTKGWSAAYRYERNAQAANKPDRWCNHSMLDAVPYEQPPEAFPLRVVSVEPTAPPA